MPGMPEKRTHDFMCHGTNGLFAAFNTVDGFVIAWIHCRLRAIEFKKFLFGTDTLIPDALDTHLGKKTHDHLSGPTRRTDPRQPRKISRRIYRRMILDEPESPSPNDGGPPASDV